MKYALITGSSSGIGLAYARQLAERGRNVIIVSNRAEDNEAVAAAIRRDFGVEALALYADLVQEDAAERIYAQCREQNAEVDILISNAGILHFGKLAHTAPDAIERTRIGQHIDNVVDDQVDALSDHVAVRLDEGSARQFRAVVVV